MKQLRHLGRVAWSGRAVAVLALAVGLALGAVGDALATGTIPGADGAFHACFDNSTGAVRLIDPSTSSCRADESATMWSQAGPQGPQGPQGPVGPPGPSNAWVVNSPSPTQLNNSLGVVVAVQVPSGSYVISAAVNIESTDLNNPQMVECVLNTGGHGNARLGAEPNGGDTAVISLLGSASFGIASTISVSCAAPNASAIASTLSALQVGTLH